MRLVVASALLAAAGLPGGRAEAEVGALQPGYPGYQPARFQFAPRRAEGRALFYRQTPKVERLQSPVHELYMRPYNYAHLEQAAAAVVSGEGVLGTVHFLQIGGPAAPVLVTGNITGLTPGLHGFHVHQLGDLSGGCKSTGGHFNPLELKHGAPGDRYRHVGDLGNIMAGEDGVAVLEITDSQLSLNGIASIIGRGVVVHAGMDDLGRGGNDGSLATGNAGGRVACGVVGRARGPA